MMSSLTVVPRADVDDGQEQGCPNAHSDGQGEDGATPGLAVVAAQQAGEGAGGATRHHSVPHSNPMALYSCVLVERHKLERGLENALVDPGQMPV